MLAYFLLVLIIVLAFSPALLSMNKKIYHKKLFSLAIIIGTIKPLSTIVVPVLYAPELFNGPMYNYLLLASIFYFFLLLFYYFSIKFIPISYNYKIPYLRKSSKIAIISFIISILFFCVLVINSRGVFLTDPRSGYQYYRTGVGFVWVFYILFVGITFYFLAIKRPINTIKVIFFTILMFFTGSKQLILEVFIKSFLVYVWADIKIKKWQIFFGSFLLTIVMLKLFGQFGSDSSFLERVGQYFDFMKNASRVFDDYSAGILPQMYGEITLSSFWSYIPRALYPDKPFAYGSTWLVEYYYPGLAATGHTPSFGMFTTEFVDFRWFAPIATIVFNLGIIIRVLSLVIVSSNANVSRYWKVGALAFVLVPGFGFHLPIFLTAIFAFVILPKLFYTKA